MANKHHNDEARWLLSLALFLFVVWVLTVWSAQAIINEWRGTTDSVLMQPVDQLKDLLEDL